MNKRDSPESFDGLWASRTFISQSSIHLRYVIYLLLDGFDMAGDLLQMVLLFLSLCMGRHSANHGVVSSLQISSAYHIRASTQRPASVSVHSHRHEAHEASDDWPNHCYYFDYLAFMCSQTVSVVSNLLCDELLFVICCQLIKNVFAQTTCSLIVGLLFELSLQLFAKLLLTTVDFFQLVPPSMCFN